MDDLSHTWPFIRERAGKHQTKRNSHPSVLKIITRKENEWKWSRDSGICVKRKLGVGFWRGGAIHFASTHPVIGGDRGLDKNFAGTLFKLNPISEHDKREVI